jgi:hypothetical protein
MHSRLVLRWERSAEFWPTRVSLSGGADFRGAGAEMGNLSAQMSEKSGYEFVIIIALDVNDLRD